MLLQILYENITKVWEAIKKYRDGDKKYNKLGDWNSIINKFVKFKDNSSANRISNIIERAITCDGK